MPQAEVTLEPHELATACLVASGICARNGFPNIGEVLRLGADQLLTPAPAQPQPDDLGPRLAQRLAEIEVNEDLPSPANRSLLNEARARDWLGDGGG